MSEARSPSSDSSGPPVPTASSPGNLAGERFGAGRFLERGKRVYRDILALFSEVLQRKRLPWSVRGGLKLLLEAELEAPAGDSDPAAQRFAERLLDGLHRLAQEAGLGACPFPPGRVRCFWCDSFECVHSFPPEPRCAFKGYSPTGEPLWQEFAALALEQQHPEIELLYESPPRPIQLVQRGSAVAREQMSLYGKHSNHYRILAQLAVGYLPLRGDEPGRASQALTVQAVETHHGRTRLHLNLIGQLTDGRPAGVFLEELADPRLADAIATARRKLHELALSLGPPREARAGGARRPGRRPGFATREAQAEKILLRLRDNLDRIYRQNSRRTLHARDRQREHARPTSSALKDALAASEERIFRDVEENTWVVLGPRNRVHVFNDAAQHVTSVVFSGEAIRKRTRKGRWRDGDAAARERFRARLRNMAQD